MVNKVNAPFVVPSPGKAKQPKVPPFQFVIEGKPYSMPPFGELVSPAELLDIAELPLAEQNGVLQQRFAKAMPKDARQHFKSHGQIAAVFSAWQQHGSQGVDAGESGASAD